MGELAAQQVSNFTAGRWGISMPVSREYPKTTQAAIAGQRFSLVEVVGGNTNRLPGTRLVVCEQNELFYWVWTSRKVTGIAKNVCRVLEADMALNTALEKLGRKSYAPPATDI